MSSGCRLCGIWGFALSAVVHLSAAGVILTRGAGGGAGDGGELSVPVTLAMFAAPSDRSAEGSAGESVPDGRQEAVPAAEARADNAESKPPEESDPAEDETEPADQARTEPGPARVAAGSAEPAPGPVGPRTDAVPASPGTEEEAVPSVHPGPIAETPPPPAEQVEEEPAPVLRPSQPPGPTAAAAHPEPAPKSRHEPSRTRPPQEPAPRPVSRPERRPEPKMAPAAKTSPPRDVGPRSSPPRQSGRPAAAPATRADSGAPEQSGAEKGRSGPSQAGASGRTGGRGASSPGIRSADAEALASRYLGELRRAIGKHRRYPPQARRRGETGTVSVAFVLHGNGRISGVRVASSSGSATLDKAATDALNRMGRFKPIPKQLARSSWPIRVPIQFQLH